LQGRSTTSGKREAGEALCLPVEGQGGGAPGLRARSGDEDIGKRATSSLDGRHRHEDFPGAFDDDNWRFQQPLDDLRHVERTEPTTTLEDADGLHQRDQADETPFVFGQGL
jgi:hypothetical protein